MAFAALPLLAAACKEPPQARAPDPIPPRPVADVLNPTACVPETTRTAFQVTALKSQLMVAALSCQQDSHYNGFIERNRRELVAHDRELTQWFRRTYGRQGQRRMDDFITSLANAQSQEGIRQGGSFCSNMGPLFREVSNIQSMPALAATKEFGAPQATTCAPGRATTASSRPRR